MVKRLFVLVLSLFVYCHVAAANETEITVADTRLKITFVTDRIVHVQATRNPNWSKAASLMLAQVAEQPGVIAARDEGDARVLRSSQLTVLLNRRTGAISFRAADGKTLLSEDAVTPRWFEKIPVMKSIADPATVKTVKTVDGERQVADRYVLQQDREAWKAAAHFRLGDDEALYGLGFDESTDLNLRGKTKRLYQHNLRIVIPFIVSTRGYGLLFDSYSAMTFADDKDGTTITSDVVDDLSYYFVLGPTMDAAIGGFRQLTGAATMLPRWAYGYVQSKERYQTQDEVVDTVRQFRQRQIPLDLIVQDWNYWRPDHWGSPVPDTSRYPDIAAMTGRVHDLNAHLMISIWPNPSPLDPPGKELKEGGYTSPGTDYVDFFQPKAGDVYFRHVWQYLGRNGIDAWWCDSTEPEVADWTWEAQRPQHADDTNILGLARVIDPQYLNAYALVDANSLMRHWREAAPDKRLVNLTRSAYPGSQAAGAVAWTGDIAASWPVFAQQVVAMQSYSASGLPYVTFDIGGFFVKRGPTWFWSGQYDNGADDLGYRELYARWLQFGAFLPMFRSHGTDTPREPWRFGAPGTPFYDAILQAIQLRYRLLPYVYSQAGLVRQRGASFIRPVAFGYPADARSHDLKTQILFGDAFMVSPVTQPMYYQANSAPIPDADRRRAVYLPQGTWIDFWTGERLAGGQTVMVDAPIAHMPLHVRAGSIVPMGPVVQYAAQQDDTPLELRIYPGADGDYTFYEDAGDGWGYEHGQFALIDMHWDDAAKQLRLGARKGSYPGMHTARRFKVVLVTRSNGRGMEQDSAATDLTYRGAEVVVEK